MYDQTDAEIARREHDAEMGVESTADRRWTKWHREATAAVKGRGWETPLTRGLDGAEAEDGFSLDYAYEAFEKGVSVKAYIEGAATRRAAMGLSS